MNISLPDQEQFKFKDCVIAGDECVLITPKEIGIKWNEQNKYFRSSIWRKSDNKLISAGFRKFTNYGEQSDFESFPQNTLLRAVEKKDGSLLIVSNHKDELIIRTRGTVDASQLTNGHEIELLKKKYPKAFNNEWLEAGWYSLLFEWTTPTNRIVLQESEEPCLWLIGMIDHFNYSYIDQFNLDQYAKEMGVLRPKTHRFLMSETLDNIKTKIEPLQDIEGVVVYDGSGQILKKVKTLRYLYLHHIFTGIKTYDNFLNLWASFEHKEIDEFEKELGNRYDWELVTSFKPFLDRLREEYQKLNLLLTEMENFVNSFNFQQLSRKQQATMIMEKYGTKSSIAFSILDNKKTKPLDKLLEYV
jgi:hypothetical protein